MFTLLTRDSLGSVDDINIDINYTELGLWGGEVLRSSLELM